MNEQVKALCAKIEWENTHGFGAVSAAAKESAIKRLLGLVGSTPPSQIPAGCRELVAFLRQNRRS